MHDLIVLKQFIEGAFNDKCELGGVEPIEEQIEWFVIHEASHDSS
jgi:hypothetical protein